LLSTYIHISPFFANSIITQFSLSLLPATVEYALPYQLSVFRFLIISDVTPASFHRVSLLTFLFPCQLKTSSQIQFSRRYFTPQFFQSVAAFQTHETGLLSFQRLRHHRLEP
jgi:hypothetical protein